MSKIRQMKLNSLYVTFQGEQNPNGIGHPAIFLRLQGCHLRCYKKTMNILCDTPEGLKKPTDKDVVAEIVAKTYAMSVETNVNLVTLTGGDPLWNEQAEVTELLNGLTDAGLRVCIETSGTISWLPYSGIHPSIFWILDYKLSSAGVKNASTLFLDPDHLDDLSGMDYIKFVVADKGDLDECIHEIHRMNKLTDANICVGAFWGGKISSFDIFDRLKSEKLLGRVLINAQLHKLLVNPNTNVVVPREI